MYPKKVIYTIYGVLLTWTLAPCILMWSSIVISFLLGNETGMENPVFFLGYDMQPILKTVGSLGYFSIITIPTGSLFIIMFSFILFMINCKKTKNEYEVE